jgi:N-acetylmuramoyl-L-alanine amidase
VVLKSPDIPSILIETGFITNLDEEKKLRTTRYQKKIANAIYRALGEYYDQTPYYNQANYSSPRVALSSGSPTTKIHKIKRGDSLSSIALKYGTTVAELKRLNKLPNNIAVLGQRLRLPRGSASSNNSVLRRGNPAVHTVVRGDSLSKISARYNVTIHALKRANRLTKNTVYKGQKIKIPGGISTKQRVTKHTVKRGDTLSEIAEQYGVTTRQMMLANGLPSGTVRLGQTLKIPR